MKLRLLLLLALVLATAGCPPPPVGEPYAAQLRGMGPQGVTLRITMKVNNPNSFDVKVRNVRANVVMAGRYRLPTMTFNPDIWLNADKSTLVPVDVTVPWSMVPSLLAATVGSTKIEYRCVGFVDVTAVRMLGIRVNDEKFDIDGEVSRGQLVQMAARGMAPMPMRR